MRQNEFQKASGLSATFLKSRIGRRPIRVDTLLDKADAVGAARQAAKVAAAGFLEELAKIAAATNDSSLIDYLPLEQLEEMLKQAAMLQGIGQGIQSMRAGMQQGLGNVAGKMQQSSFGPVRGLGKGLQVANTSHQQLGAQMAQAGHHMQQSPSAFKQGIGQALHHKGEAWQKPGMRGAANAAWSMLNPIGTAAEVGATGAGAAAAKGLQSAGRSLQQAAPAVDPVMAQGRAMTPVGKLQNAATGVAQRVGGGMERTFGAGGTGHNVLTKHIPHAVEMAAPAALGAGLHIPTGLAGMLGGKMLGAAGAGHAVTKAVGQGVGHLVSDVVGTKGPLFAGRLAARMAPSFAG